MILSAQTLRRIRPLAPFDGSPDDYDRTDAGRDAAPPPDDEIPF